MLEKDIISVNKESADVIDMQEDINVQGFNEDDMIDVELNNNDTIHDHNDISKNAQKVSIRKHIDPDYDMSAVLILGCFEGAPFIIKTLGLNIHAQPGDIIFFKASELDHAVCFIF